MAGGNTSATLSCDTDRVYNLTLMDHFMTYGTYGTRLFHPCFTKASTHAAWQVCSSNMTLYCRSKFQATAVKTIRLQMARAVEVIRQDPKVKIVHLVRDPRAVLLSRHKLGFANFKNLAFEAQLLCDKYREDLVSAATLKAQPELRERYRLVRYEDIAASPMNHTRQMYDYMGLELTPHILQSIQGMMEEAKKTKACPTCKPIPLNSTEVSQAWRGTMTLQDVQTISSKCEHVLRLLGYRVHFTSGRELEDLSITAVDPLLLS